MRAWWPLVAVAVTLGGAFILAPGDIAHKSHALLHGVCAQRPSHTLVLGGAALPVDARMTGIYLGAAVMIVWLLASGRFRASRFPSVPVVMTLAGFVGVMAIDGFNALLLDLGAPRPYSPSNWVRLATGILAGLTLGAAVAHVFASAVWRDGDRRTAVIERPVEIVAPLVIALAAGLPALSGLAVFYLPYAIGLSLAVILVFWVVATAVSTAATGRAFAFTSFRELAPMASLGLMLAVGGVVGLALARSAAELFLGLPKLT